jgi:hypothetical protein
MMMDVGSTASVLEVYTASIFRAEVSRMSQTHEGKGMPLAHVTLSGQRTEQPFLGVP